MRKLKKSNEYGNEYNVLVIENLDSFFGWANSFSKYKSNFEILKELEDKVKLVQKFEQVELIEYCDDNYCLFDFVSYKEVDGQLIVTYSYATTIS